MNSESANIAIETLKIAQGLATLQSTKDDIAEAIEWAEEMAILETIFGRFHVLETNNQYAIDAAADWENPSNEQMRRDWEDAL
jgi:hypothetical protein